MLKMMQMPQVSVPHRHISCGHCLPQHRPFSAHRCRPHLRCRQQGLIVRAAGEDDAEFEDRISRLRKAKGQTPYGQSREDGDKKKTKVKTAGRKQYDYSGEEVWLETQPHRGDLATNIALGATLLWLPLTAAAIGRAAFVKYRFTDRRLSVVTTAPWKDEQLDAAYQEVKDVVTVGRGLGLWGDMVVTLQNGDKVEIRSLPRFQEVKEYILKQRDALVASSLGEKPAAPAGKKGFA